MQDALRAGDQDRYFRVLARLDLLLPVPAGASAQPPKGWGTWAAQGRTHVLAFTSPSALRACLADHTGTYRQHSLEDLATNWPDQTWWLAVNPGLPIEGYLPAWYLSGLGVGEVQLPGRTLGAQARVEHARRLQVHDAPQQPASDDGWPKFSGPSDLQPT
ncbi:MAG: hypothetical protein HKP61_13795, partial [Dactylosporangium sp.]|nr:hypothetical protein [Dactylosporangium sp.]NNJ61987.1 hypothetical protein [Dactylosporangium sp.]